MSDWYSAASVPAFRAKAVSATIRNEFAAVETAMGKLPTLTGNGSKLVAVNSGGTALEAVTNVSVAQGGTGATTAAAARTALGLAIGTDVQAYNAKLAAIVALSATDGGFIVGDGATFVEESGATARASLGLVIGTDVQAYNAKLAAIAGLTPTDSVFIVGNGTTFVAESGATARTSLGLGSLATASTISNDNWSGTDLAVANGGTGASTASGARTALGLAIGTDVQAYNAKLAAIVALSATDGGFIVGDGATFVEESGATARASLGLVIGTDVQAYNAKLAAIAGLTPTDSVFIVGNGTTFVAESGATARASLGLVIGTDVQAYNAKLAAIAGLTPTDSVFIVGNGTTFVAESGATARTSLGLGSLATASTISNDNWSGTDLAVANGGTGASTASGARTALGLAIGTDVQAYNAKLAAIAGLTPTDSVFIVGNGTTFVAESGATARTSLGLGSLATASTISNDNWSGTDLAVANGGTGASTASGARTALGVAIGSDVQAYSSLLAAIAAITPTDSVFLVGNGSTFVSESGTTVRTSLGLGTGNSPTFAGLTLSTPLSVANGGTGASSLTAGCVLLGSGTGAITALDVTAKGALLVGDGTGDPRALLAGADGYVLTLDSAQTVGMKWAAVTSGTVTSVSGGTGLTGTVTTTGSLNLDISGLTAVEVDALIASDGILIDDGGTMKRMRIDDMGTIVQSAATQTLATTDNNSIIYNSGASTYTITAPSDATAAIPVGGQIGLMCSGTGRLTVAAGSGATVTSLNSNLSVKASGGAAVLVKVSTNGWMLVGDLEAT